MKTMDRAQFQKRFDGLESEYNTKWRPTHQELQQFICPERGFFYGSTPNNGEKLDHKSLLNDTANRSGHTLAAGIQNGLTSQSRPWFRLATSDPDLNLYQPVKEYLDIVQRILYGIFSRSNMYHVFHSMYEEIGPFGTAASIILPDYYSVIRGRSFTIGEYYLGVGDDGRVNSFARRVWKTVGQLVETYGENAVSDIVKKLYNDHRVDEWVELSHLIEPNDERNPLKKDATNMPFRSIYWESKSDQNQILQFSGFEEFPVIAPRWRTRTSTDIYGYGPGHTALGNSKTLQIMEEDSLLGLDKLVDPPISAPGSTMDRHMIDTHPGGISWRGSNDTEIKAVYQVNPDIKSVEYKIQRIEEKVERTFFVHLFAMFENQTGQMTAREVVEKHEEKLTQVGPVVERLQSEQLDQAIGRGYNTSQRNGLFPDPPRELQDADIRIEYTSILAQALKMMGTTSVEQFVGFAGRVAAVKPEVLDKLDLDETIDQYADMVGVPPTIVVADDKVAKIRQDRLKQQQQQQAMETAMVAAQGAKTLSETETGKNSALDALLNRGGGA